jgi:hypothetical protein
VGDFGTHPSESVPGETARLAGDVPGQDVDAIFPAARFIREARRLQNFGAETCLRERVIARTQQDENARNAEILAAAQQFMKHDLADIAGDASEENIVTLRQRLHRHPTPIRGSSPI